MNAGRFVGAVVGVWIVRVLLNWTFYTQIVGSRYAAIAEGHPGMFREVIPAYIVADLLFAVVFALLFVWVGRALGGGVKGGVKLGIFAALLGPILGFIYQYYSTT